MKFLIEIFCVKQINCDYSYFSITVHMVDNTIGSARQDMHQEIKLKKSIT